MKVVTIDLELLKTLASSDIMDQKYLDAIDKANEIINNQDCHRPCLSHEEWDSFTNADVKPTPAMQEAILRLVETKKEKWRQKALETLSSALVENVHGDLDAEGVLRYLEQHGYTFVSCTTPVDWMSVG